MKISRVLLASNDHPEYIGFWEYISDHYWNKFGIMSSLAYLGTKHTPRTTKYANVIHVKPNQIKDHDTTWQTSWSLFWSAQHYPDELCVVMGIDQVPLSRRLLKYPEENYKTGAYFMLISNGYSSPPWAWLNSGEGCLCPSSYHSATGNTFKEAYGLEQDFNNEIQKVYDIGLFHDRVDPINPKFMWGIDEAYTLIKLREYHKKTGLVECPGLMQEYDNKRFYRGMNYNKDEILDGIRNDVYTEFHGPRPFKNDKKWYEQVSDACPDWR